MTDGPLPRTLKVGRTSIGLVGLDVALNRIGRDLLERCLINGHPLTLRHVPYFA